MCGVDCKTVTVDLQNHKLLLDLNKLPNIVVEADGTNQFKKSLDEYK